MSLYTRYVGRSIREIVIDPLILRPTDYLGAARATAYKRSRLTQHPTPVPVVVEDEWGEELAWVCAESVKKEEGGR